MLTVLVFNVIVHKPILVLHEVFEFNEAELGKAITINDPLIKVFTVVNCNVYYAILFALFGVK